MTAVRLQTVRYGNEVSAILRTVRSIAASARLLRKRRGEVAVSIAIGDCGGPEGAGDVMPERAIAEARDLVSAAGAELEHLVYGTNIGHGAGHNRLAANLEESAGAEPADVLVILNPDTYVPPGFLASLVAVLDRSEVGIAEARQIPLEHPKPFDRATGETPWASGCAMALRADVFGAAGGFDEAFFLHGDDVDLSWRVRLMDKRVIHVPQAAVFHDKRPTSSGFPAPSEAEEYHAMLARLLLAHRAERADVIEQWVGWSSAEGSALQRQAVDEFQSRLEGASLPRTYRETLGLSAEAVASVVAFVGSEYAEHRF